MGYVHHHRLSVVMVVVTAPKPVRPVRVIAERVRQYVVMEPVMERKPMLPVRAIVRPYVEIPFVTAQRLV